MSRGASAALTHCPQQTGSSDVHTHIRTCTHTHIHPTHSYRSHVHTLTVQPLQRAHTLLHKFANVHISTHVIHHLSHNLIITVCIGRITMRPIHPTRGPLSQTYDDTSHHLYCTTNKLNHTRERLHANRNDLHTGIACLSMTPNTK